VEGSGGGLILRYYRGISLEELRKRVLLDMLIIVLLIKIPTHD
jgi:hypothetical protein